MKNKIDLINEKINWSTNFASEFVGIEIAEMRYIKGPKYWLHNHFSKLQRSLLRRNESFDLKHKGHK